MNGPLARDNFVPNEIGTSQQWHTSDLQGSKTPRFSGVRPFVPHDVCPRMRAELHEFFVK
jgi:hypothetical protein